jgi:hypothetical protein
MIDMEHLNLIFEDSSSPMSHVGSSAYELVERLRNARQLVADIEHQLGTIKHRMCAELALGIRRAQPGIHVALDKNGCKIGYKTKMLLLNPDVENEIWTVTSKNRRFLHEFLKANRRHLLIGQDPTILINAIVSHFIAYFRTLHESIGGTGIILVEERRGTLVDIINWRDAEVEKSSQPIMSRQRRGITCG